MFKLFHCPCGASFGIAMVLTQALERAIEEYNRYHSPEAHAQLLSAEGATFRVAFSGYFCHTCGVYDYFEDLQVILKDWGLETRILEVEETPEGAVVTFQVVL